MSDLYGKTTESLESLQNISCATKFKACGPPGSSSKSKQTKQGKQPKPGPSIDMEMEEQLKQEKQERDEYDQPSIGLMGGDSDVSLDPYNRSNDDVRINQPGKPRLSRAKSVKETLTKGAKGTLDFFGVADDTDESDREKWNRRRIRHLSRIGKVKESVSAPNTPDTPDGIHHFAKVVDYAMQRSYVTKSNKRENAAKLLWKTAARRLSARPQYDVSTIQSFGGRSFAPADLMDDDISVFDSSDDRRSITPTPTPLATTPSFLDSHSFFHFDTHYPSTIEEEDSMDITDGGRPEYGERPEYHERSKYDERPEYDERPKYGERPEPPSYQSFLHSADRHSADRSAPSTPSQRIVSSWDRTLGPEPAITAASPSAHRKPAYLRQPSDRRGRLHVKPQIKKKKSLKREFGKGLVGNLLNRTFNRNRINSKIREQMEDISDHRPFFTYWISFVQVVILIVMVSVYPFAPVGVSQKTYKENVYLSRNGVLQSVVVKKEIVESFWIGPSLQTLIRLGAKYAPCMRHDKLLYNKLHEEKMKENQTGCCIGTFNDGCIQRHQSECMSSFTTFKPRTVCGLDPVTCLNPASKVPNKWDEYTITNWPVCHKSQNASGLDVDKFAHMKCEITGRPCCIGTQAHCIITSQDYCSFNDGIYHKDKSLCSQVDCLSSTCGLLPFAKDNQPDQFYRLWLSLFLNAGLLHCVLILIFNFTILRDIEKMAGWIRTGLIFLLSGICGNLWSSILIPYEPEVGPSGAAFGIIACLFVEVIQSWQLIKQPFVALGKLCGIVLVLFLLGLLPYIDNYAHIFGFVHGFLLALIFMPYVTFGEWDTRRKRIQIAIAAVVLLVITIVGFVLFYVNQEINTSGVKYFNCVPITEDFCKNFHQGQRLEDRQTIY